MVPANTSSTVPRSSTGHALLPAFGASEDRVPVPVVTPESLVSWTFGRGTVIWRIWPAVLLHTVFAAAVVSISLKTSVKLGIPNVMLTLLGVVIGFVISYRASSGYDRYWQGRSAWSDLARTSRTLSRLIWIHVPLKLDQIQADTTGRYPEVCISVARRVMAEKRVALDLIEGFVVAVKHHLRGEPGIYYEDLYPLVKPLHKHGHHHRSSQNQPSLKIDDLTASFHDLHPETPPFTITPSAAQSSSSAPQPTVSRDPFIPPINTYGTFTTPPLQHSYSLSSFSSDVSSEAGHRRPLLPGAVPNVSDRRGVFGSVATDLIPFATFLRSVGHILGFRRRHVYTSDTEVDVESPVDAGDEGGIQRSWAEYDVNSIAVENGHNHVHAMHYGPRLGTHSKHRPRIAGAGENIPLEILRSLSIWLSVLDERGVVPGGALGGMFGALAAFEDSLSALERILTTPLPFVYSVHISTVWIYLFFLPFQLVDLFAWYAIPGVGIAAFIYLGLVAAGEEIEQPFGYDENDLDLDFFCRAIIHADLDRIRRISCPNVYLGSHHSGTHIPAAHDVAIDLHSKVDTVFGGAHRL